jgi:hypothetical protein
LVLLGELHAELVSTQNLRFSQARKGRRGAHTSMVEWNWTSRLSFTLRTVEQSLELRKVGAPPRLQAAHNGQPDILRVIQEPATRKAKRPAPFFASPFCFATLSRLKPWCSTPSRSLRSIHIYRSIIYLSAYLSIDLSIYLKYLSVYIYIYIYIYLSISVNMFVCIYIYIYVISKIHRLCVYT